MFVLGITGGIGTGKSTVASIVRSAGIAVLDADRIAHDLTSRAGETTEAIARVFGPKALNEDGSLDRPYMARLAFTNRRALDELSAIVHQKVVETMDRELALAGQKKVKVMALDVPIPVERGFVNVCDQIWAVDCDRDIRLRRLMRRGMPEEEARRRMDVQMTPEEYAGLARHVIVNNGSLAELESRVLTLLDEELTSRGILL
ncbi:MAG TPA: dephospho-CoA kinase [Clostridiaceae bacterium]|nr:dephospho-CoA kinase [Clostridiaceae bacterium]